VKKVARELLDKLQQQLAIIDWKSRQRKRAEVQSAIQFALNEVPDERIRSYYREERRKLCGPSLLRDLPLPEVKRREPISERRLISSR
jgi:glucose-6-phosphate-specific signal transduction histidine kinase